VPEKNYIALAKVGRSTTTAIEKTLISRRVKFFPIERICINSQSLLSPALSRSETSERTLVLEVSGLTKVYRSRIRTNAAFENIAFSLFPGEIVAVLGPSGCGKSSFLKTVAGLEPATHGSIRALNQTVSAPIPQFSFVFQQPVLFPRKLINIRNENALLRPG
jgi:ABC-type glutathione transport system ATPase component